MALLLSLCRCRGMRLMHAQRLLTRRLRHSVQEEDGATKIQNILKLDFATYKQLVQRWCTADAPPLLAGRAEGGAAAAAGGGGNPGKRPRAN